MINSTDIASDTEAHQQRFEHTKKAQEEKHHRAHNLSNAHCFYLKYFIYNIELTTDLFAG